MAIISIRVDDARRRADVLVDGQPFTAYRWPEDVAKPVLYPLRSARGTPVTRGFPIDPLPNERTDHPHHVGMWFNFGDVNGLDFWNNSPAVPAANRDRYGSIVHRGLDGLGDGEVGQLSARADWVDAAGTVLLRERSDFRFTAGPQRRVIDRKTTLEAAIDVLFRDNKEGTFGIRVSRFLEHPSTELARFTDAQGRPSDVPRMANEGVNGRYRSSAGLEGDAVWGTRAEWVRLSGRLGEEQVHLVIFDHPSNPGHPTYWHARGYGLFAANPLGQKPLSQGREELNLRLARGELAVFRYRVIIDSNPTLDDEALNAEFRAFATSEFASPA